MSPPQPLQRKQKGHTDQLSPEERHRAAPRASSKAQCVLFTFNLHKCGREEKMEKRKVRWQGPFLLVTQSECVSRDHGRKWGCQPSGPQSSLSSHPAGHSNVSGQAFALVFKNMYVCICVDVFMCADMHMTLHMCGQKTALVWVLRSCLAQASVLFAAARCRQASGPSHL